MKMKLKKTASLNERSRWNIQEGKLYEGNAIGLSVEGNYFFCGNLRTSTVLEIIDNHHFRTENSIYHFEILKDDKAHTIDSGGLGESKSIGEDVSSVSGVRGDDVP